MEPNQIAFGVADPGNGAHPRRQLGARDHDVASRLGDARQHGVKRRLRVQISHHAADARLGTADRGLPQLYVQEGLIEKNGSIKVGRGDFKPYQPMRPDAFKVRLLWLCHVGIMLHPS